MIEKDSTCVVKVLSVIIRDPDLPRFYSRNSAEFMIIMIRLYGDFKINFRDSPAIAVNQCPPRKLYRNYILIIS